MRRDPLKFSKPLFGEREDFRQTRFAYIYNRDGRIWVTIGQYADFANFNDSAIKEGIDEAVSNVAKEMSYKMGTSLSSLIETTANNAKPLYAVHDETIYSVTNDNIKKLVEKYAKMDVEATEKFYSKGIIHPFMVNDLTNDKGLGSLEL